MSRSLSVSRSLCLSVSLSLSLSSYFSVNRLSNISLTIYYFSSFYFQIITSVLRKHFFPLANNSVRKKNSLSISKQTKWYTIVHWQNMARGDCLIECLFFHSPKTRLLYKCTLTDDDLCGTLLCGRHF